jgi:hypothetical protein
MSWPSEEFLKRPLEPFRPYVYVCSELTSPSSISAAAWSSGGSYKRINLHEGDTRSKVQNKIRNYLLKYQGLCPHFGKATAFLWVRSESEGTLFGLDVEEIGERTGDFWPEGIRIQKTMDFESVTAHTPLAASDTP